MAGSTEVTNNLLALYMQEQRQDNPTMDRLPANLQKIEMWLSRHDGHGWSQADNGMKLAMFGQLKLWAEDHFDIGRWYPDTESRPALFNDDQGWNMFKLAHRKARGDTVGDDVNGEGNNYCSASASGLSQGDLLMTCLSYLSGYDLSEYFGRWNPSEVRADQPDGSSVYSGGLTQDGYAKVREMGLPKPEQSPLSYTDVTKSF